MTDEEPYERIEIGRQNIVAGKRYMVFAGSGYYPLGAMDDLALMTDDKSEVEEMYNVIKKNPYYVLNWCNVYDTKTGTIWSADYGKDGWDTNLKENKNGNR